MWSIERKKKEGERERRKGGEEKKIIMEKIGGCKCRKNREIHQRTQIHRKNLKNKIVLNDPKR